MVWSLFKLFNLRKKPKDIEVERKLETRPELTSIESYERIGIAEITGAGNNYIKKLNNMRDEGKSFGLELAGHNVVKVYFNSDDENILKEIIGFTDISRDIDSNIIGSYRTHEIIELIKKYQLQHNGAQHLNKDGRLKTKWKNRLARGLAGGLAAVMLGGIALGVLNHYNKKKVPVSISNIYENAQVQTASGSFSSLIKGSGNLEKSVDNISFKIPKGGCVWSGAQEVAENYLGRKLEIKKTNGAWSKDTQFLDYVVKRIAERNKFPSGNANLVYPGTSVNVGIHDIRDADRLYGK